MSNEVRLVSVREGVHVFAKEIIVYIATLLIGMAFTLLSFGNDAIMAVGTIATAVLCNYCVSNARLYTVSCIICIFAGVSMYPFVANFAKVTIDMTLVLYPVVAVAVYTFAYSLRQHVVK